MVEFDTFDTDETRDNQKELDRGRKLQQSGHVLHASLVVTRGKVTNFGGAAAVHFSFQVIPSQRTQPPYLAEVMFTKTQSSAPATATEQATAQAAAAAEPPAAASEAASTEQPVAPTAVGAEQAAAQAGEVAGAGKLKLNIEWCYCTCKKGAVRTCGALLLMLLWIVVVGVVVVIVVVVVVVVVVVCCCCCCCCC